MPNKSSRRIIFQDLENYNVYVEDTQNTIFNVHNVPNIFPQGQSYFLILGSLDLTQGSDLLIEILDSNGNTIYYEIPVYLESTGRAISVWIYSNVYPGTAKITIVGQLEDVPLEWKGKYNVKRTFNITIDPLKSNTQPIKFITTPVVSASIANKLFLEYTDEVISYKDYSVGTAEGNIVGDQYYITLSGSGAAIVDAMLNGSFYASYLTEPGKSSFFTSSYSSSIINISNYKQFLVDPPPSAISYEYAINSESAVE